MDFKILSQIVENVLRTIENSAIASVRSLKEHTFPTRVTNFPKTQDIKGTVIVGNQKNVEKQLQEIKKPLPIILQAIKSIVFPKSFEVSNFPKYPEPIKSVEISNFPPPIQLKEIKISNQPTLELQNIKEQVGKVEKAVKGLKLDPTINVQAPKPERVIVPPAQVTLNEKEIDYDKLAKAIADEMPAEIDYKKLADAIGKKLSEGLVSIGGGGGAGRTPFRTEDGKHTQAIVGEGGFLKVDVRNGNMLTSFETNEVDKSTSPIVYNGLEDKDGNWCIQKIDKSAGPSVRFATAINNDTYTTFPTAWTNRADLDYGYFSAAF